jgi:hypothetical protein
MASLSDIEELYGSDCSDSSSGYETPSYTQREKEKIYEEKSSVDHDLERITDELSKMDVHMTIWEVDVFDRLYFSLKKIKMYGSDLADRYNSENFIVNTILTSDMNQDLMRILNLIYNKIVSNSNRHIKIKKLYANIDKLIDQQIKDQQPKPTDEYFHILIRTLFLMVEFVKDNPSAKNKLFYKHRSDITSCNTACEYIAKELKKYIS